MPFVAPCPRCQRKLQVPDACEGASVRCPACQATFLAPASLDKKAAFGLATTSEPRAGASAPVAVADYLTEEGIVEASGVAHWTDRGAWHRVHSGLGWVAVGLVVGLAVLFLQYLPALLHLSGVELAAFNDDEFWSQEQTMALVFRRTVGLTVLFFFACLLAGLLRCLMYPAPGRGAPLALVAFVLFVFWSLGWLVGDAITLLEPSNTDQNQEQFRAAILNLLGLSQLAVFVLFLRELGRDCGDRTVQSRLWWLLASAAGAFGLGWVIWSLTAPNSFREIIPFIGVLVVQVQLIRLVLAAREAAGRQAQPSAQAPVVFLTVTSPI